VPEQIEKRGQQQKNGKQEKGSERVEKVLVAVKSSKEIPKTALIWALSHVVQPGDCITFLVVVPPPSSGIICVLKFLLNKIRLFTSKFMHPLSN